ncbi:hypothetical protein FE773_07515 [Caminibacter mediatlanticus TB-2]|uniref:Uncharacterized protein n=1 Tax=Caminibacter mediatlanticus TB-2 TaxID=391592 RepID=A0ABX5V9U9_9BACT|nr:hypothetical protein [Caminibacter mediatlanticus]QCT95043.1 hypothetical protein FE773_07515 [Caminibacter mediatlanticus TB-2]
MLSNLFKIGKILKETNRLNGIKEFNTQIPIKIEVIKEINPITYKIKLGRKEVDTKSSIPLEIGKKYFAIVKEKKNYVEISNLKEYPKLLDKLEKIPISTNIHLDKEKIIKHLSNSTDKNEFLFFANILLALQKKIYHIFINNKNNKAIMQYKFNKNKIKFYACYKFLGEIEGDITPTKITLYTPYQNVANLLINNSNEIDIDIEVFIKENIKELYEFTNSLIDIKV